MATAAAGNPLNRSHIIEQALANTHIQTDRHGQLQLHFMHVCMYVRVRLFVYNSTPVSLVTLWMLHAQAL